MIEENKIKPSIDVWLDEAKASSIAAKEGMFLLHNGIVRQTTKRSVRQNIDDNVAVKGMFFNYNKEKVMLAIEKTKKMPGVFHVRVWLNSGDLKVGDDIMYVLVGGDIRPHVINALQTLVEIIKIECVTEVEK